MSTIQETINTLQELQELIDQAPAGFAQHAQLTLEILQMEVDHRVDNLRISLEVAGQPDAVRVEAAAQLICEMWSDGGTDYNRYRDRLISDALEVVLLDQPHRIDRVTLWKETWLRAQRLIEDSLEQRDLIFDLHIARGMAERDRELLGLPAAGELTADQVEAARQQAEAAAGKTKNGRVYPRFKNAQQRLLLVMANEP